MAGFSGLRQSRFAVRGVHDFGFLRAVTTYCRVQGRCRDAQSFRVLGSLILGLCLTGSGLRILGFYKAIGLKGRFGA